ncbi:iron-containing alcohol dehydrogenase [bacterium]|nr:iron-containing alcohol dehydrogenase [bacterium]
MFKQLTIKSWRFEYQVFFEEDFTNFVAKHKKEGDFFLIDHNVYKLYRGAIEPLIREHSHLLIHPSEKAKSYSDIGDVIEKLISSNLKKNDRLIAIGGGITQDIASFTASIYFRGIDWFFIPTNLLSQCDSCIGSKTSVNFESFKNQLGGFYPPSAVCIDINFLKTLPPSEILSGMGEMAHFFLLEGEDAYSEFEKNFEQTVNKYMLLKNLIYKSLSIKKKLIETDEFDQGARQIFNYGHSFGHALETMSGYRLPHGIAVSYGIDLANTISVQLGFLKQDVQLRIRHTLKKIWADFPLPDISYTGYWEALAKDKKNKGQEIRVILSRGHGEMFITSLPVTIEVEKSIRLFLENN